MKKIPLACLIAAFPLLTSAGGPDAKVAWLAEHSHELRSTRALAGDDYADLAPLGEALAQVRVIALGESTHGDGSTMEMKTRLIRYLHEQLGFDVIAWESGMADMAVVHASLCDPQILPEVAVSKGMYPIWTASRQLLPLWEYVRESHTTTRPLTLAGFDCKFTANVGGGFAVHAMGYLRSFFERAYQTRDEDLKWAQLELATRKLQSPMHNPGAGYDAGLYDERFVADLSQRIETNPAAFQRAWSARDIEFTRQLLKSFGYIARYMRESFDDKGNFTAARDDTFTRDMGMGLNLLWLVEKAYPDRKIIVWAHNGHLTKGFDPRSRDRDFRDAGLRGSAFAHVKHALGDKAYVLGFLSSEGAFNYPNVPGMKSREQIPPPAEGSLQALCAAAGRSPFFVDLTSLPHPHWLRRPLSAGFMFHGTGYEDPTQMIKDWTSEFDGMIYIRTMEPSLPLQRIGTEVVTR